MKTTHKIFNGLALGLLLLGQTACKKDNNTAESNLPTGTPEIINADITSSRTLVNRVQGVDYEMQGNIDVLGSSTVLTINEGVTIRFTQGSGLYIGPDATLTANGSSSANITFTGAQAVAGYWDGIVFKSLSTSNLLRYCIVEHAGNSGNTADNPACVNLGVNGNNPGAARLENCTIRTSANFGVYVDKASYFTGFTSNTLSDAATYPLGMFYTCAGSLNSNNTFSGNTNNFILLKGESSAAFYANYASLTIPKMNVPYMVQGILANENGTTNISAGVEMVFLSAAGFLTMDYTNDEPTLNFNGTASEPITLRGRDNVAGAWRGVHISKGNLTMNHVTMQNANGPGGYSSTTQTANCSVSIYVAQGTSNVNITGCNISNNSGDGIKLYRPYAASTLNYNSDIKTGNTFTVTGCQVRSYTQGSTSNTCL